jgi:hypothetical protein
VKRDDRVCFYFFVFLGFFCFLLVRGYRWKKAPGGRWSLRGQEEELSGARPHKWRHQQSISMRPIIRYKVAERKRTTWSGATVAFRHSGTLFSSYYLFKIILNYYDFSFSFFFFSSSSRQNKIRKGSKSPRSERI